MIQPYPSNAPGQAADPRPPGPAGPIGPLRRTPERGTAHRV